MKAIARQVRISPKKANLIAGMVRGKNVEEAKEMLGLLPKKGAQILYKVLNSAVANAVHNFGQDGGKLEIKSILVTKGSFYKRSTSGSRGRMNPILKRTSHISVEVGII